MVHSLLSLILLLYKQEPIKKGRKTATKNDMAHS